MRIICPRCDAAYDIPDRAIPVSGREVQCSACTHAWYQLPPNSAIPPGPLALPPEASGGADAGARDSASTATEPPAPPRRRLDPEVLRVLREEAAREQQARRKPANDLIEAQSDLDLPDPPKPARAPVSGNAAGLRARLAKLQAAEGADPSGIWSRGEDELGRPSPRRRQGSDTPPKNEAKKPGSAEAPPESLHPVLQEPVRIPPPKTPAEPTAGVPARRPGLPVKVSAQDLAVIAAREERRGFRWGFGMTAGLGTLALAAYIVAPALAQAVPSTAPLVRQVVQTGAAVQSVLVGWLQPVTQLLGV